MKHLYILVFAMLTVSVALARLRSANSPAAP